MSFIHPDDIEHATKKRRGTMKTSVLVETAYRIISKTGKIKHFRSSGSLHWQVMNTHLLVPYKI